MSKITIKPRAKKFIEKLPPKHQRQVKGYLLSFLKNPFPEDVKPLKGYEPYFRGDIGEYRVIYRYSKPEDLVSIVLVGKRNDGEIYKIARRAL